MFVSLREQRRRHPRRRASAPHAGRAAPALARRRPSVPALADRRAAPPPGQRARGSRARDPVRAPDDLVVARTPRPPLEPRLIVASNRLPAAPTGDRQREVGGLVSALLPALAETSGIWLGWSGAERDPGLRLRIEDGDAYHARAVRLPADAGASSSTPASATRACGRCSTASPGACATSTTSGPATSRRIAPTRGCCSRRGGPNAEIWVQDFHLMLVGARAAPRRPPRPARLLPPRAVSAARRVRDDAVGGGGDGRAARVRSDRAAGPALGRQLLRDRARPARRRGRGARPRARPRDPGRHRSGSVRRGRVASRDQRARLGRVGCSAAAS